MFNIEFKEINNKHYKVTVGEPNIWEYKGDYYNVRYKQLEPEILKILDMHQEEYYSL